MRLNRKNAYGLTVALGSIFLLSVCFLIALPGSSPRGFPALMFHRIGNERGNPLVISPDQFEQEVKYLSDNNYRSISLSELNGFLRHHRPLPPKPILITFDDGNTSDVAFALPILKKYRFTAVSFVLGDTLDHGGLSGKDLQLLSSEGWDIGNHTYSHAHLGKLNRLRQIEEVDRASGVIQQALSTPPLYLSYPVGSYNAETIDILKSRGILLAFTTEPGWVTPNTDPYQIPRVAIGPQTGDINFRLKLNTPFYPARLKHMLMKDNNQDT